MCNACGFYCCAMDCFEGCGCDHCECEECHKLCSVCGEEIGLTAVAGVCDECLGLEDEEEF